MKLDDLIKEMIEDKVLKDANNIPMSTIKRMEEEMNKNTRISTQNPKRFSKKVLRLAAVGVCVLAAIVALPIIMNTSFTDTTDTSTATDNDEINSEIDSTAQFDEYIIGDALYTNHIGPANAWGLNKMYDSIKEMKTDADHVISGRVANVRYFQPDDDYFIYEMVDIVIEKAYKGSLRENTIITVVTDIKYGDYIEYLVVIGADISSIYEYNEEFREAVDDDKKYLSKYYQDDWDYIKEGAKLMLFLSDMATYYNKDVYILNEEETFMSGEPVKVDLNFPTGTYIPCGYTLGTYALDNEDYISVSHLQYPNLHSPYIPPFMTTNMETVITKSDMIDMLSDDN